MKRAIISTTIHDPLVFVEWSQNLREGDKIFVSGDRKTPHDQVRATLAETHVPSRYFHPDEQEKWNISDVIGWNCIQRRNIATLEAMLHKPDWAITIDTDNETESPNSWADQVDEIMLGVGGPHPIVIEDDGEWFNPGLIGMPATVFRGFPLPQRHAITRHNVKIVHATEYPIGVIQMMILGNPDIDAIERIANSPHVVKINNPAVIFERGTWGPFNSQATVIRGELLPLFFMMPHIGRFDDIWASYIMRHWMDQNGWFVQYGEPAVYQRRWEHDLVKDLKAEMFGYEYTPAFASGLRQIDLKGSSPRQALDEIYKYVNTRDYIPQLTKYALFEWIKDVDTVQLILREQS